MLERLQLKDFQAHARRSIDLAPGVTAIVGPSDAGKSSIIRALRWVCFNQPDGDEFKRWGSPGVAVRLTVDGHVVTRCRTKDENKYELDGQEYKAFGRGGVPDTVAGLLRLTPANFQQQHDPPYWLADTPGEVSRRLNAVVDLGCIDQALASAGRRHAAARAAEGAAKDALAVAKAAHEALAWVKEAVSDYVDVEAAGVLMRRAVARAAALRTAVAALQAARLAHDKAVARHRAVEALLPQAVASGKAGKRRDALAATIAEARRLQRDAAGKAPPPASLATLRGLLDKALAARQRHDALDGAVLAATAAARKAADARKEARRAADAFAEAAEGACPVCGGPLKNSE